MISFSPFPQRVRHLSILPRNHFGPWRADTRLPREIHKIKSGSQKKLLRLMMARFIFAAIIQLGARRHALKVASSAPRSSSCAPHGQRLLAGRAGQQVVSAARMPFRHECFAMPTKMMLLSSFKISPICAPPLAQDISPPRPIYRRQRASWACHDDAFRFSQHEARAYYARFSGRRSGHQVLPGQHIT